MICSFFLHRWRSTPWRTIPAAEHLTSHPAAFTLKNKAIAVFARGKNNLLHGAFEKSPSDASPNTRKFARWSSWELLGGEDTKMASMPAVSAMKDGRIVVFSVSMDAQVQYIVQTDPDAFGFGEWRQLGTLPVPIKGLPEPVLTPEGDLIVYAVGEDTNLYTARVTDAYVWTSWRKFDDGGATRDGVLRVRAGSTPGGRVSLYALNDENQLQMSFQKLLHTRYWTPWMMFGPQRTMSLAGVSVTRNDLTEMLTIVGRLPDSTLMLRIQDRSTGWTNWQDIGGHVKRDPFLVSEPGSGVHIFAVGLDGVVLHKALIEGGHTKWVPLPGILCD